MSLFHHLIWFVVLSIGNAEILVTLVNRIHALPVRERCLREIRHIHDLLIPLFPFWLVVVIGCFGPGVFFETITPAETWHRLPWMVQAYFGVCCVGFSGFLVSLVRHNTYRPASQQVEFSSTVTDVEDELGFRPTGPGRNLSLTKLPGNQCFEVEWTERTFELPRIPKEWDGLTILHLTDLHFIGTLSLPFFEFITEKAQSLNADLICFTGDLLDGDEFKTRSTIRQVFHLGKPRLESGHAADPPIADAAWLAGCRRKIDQRQHSRARVIDRRHRETVDRQPSRLWNNRRSVSAAAESHSGQLFVGPSQSSRSCVGWSQPRRASRPADHRAGVLAQSARLPKRRRSFLFGPDAVVRQPRHLGPAPASNPLPTRGVADPTPQLDGLVSETSSRSPRRVTPSRKPLATVSSFLTQRAGQSDWLSQSTSSCNRRPRAIDFLVECIFFRLLCTKTRAEIRYVARRDAEQLAVFAYHIERRLAQRPVEI